MARANEEEEEEGEERVCGWALGVSERKREKKKVGAGWAGKKRWARKKGGLGGKMGKRPGKDGFRPKEEKEI